MPSLATPFPYTLAQTLSEAAARCSHQLEFLARFTPEHPQPYELVVRLRGSPRSETHRFDSWPALEGFLTGL